MDLYELLMQRHDDIILGITKTMDFMTAFLTVRYYTLFGNVKNKIYVGRRFFFFFNERLENYCIMLTMTVPGYNNIL